MFDEISRVYAFFWESFLLRVLACPGNTVKCCMNLILFMFLNPTLDSNIFAAILNVYCIHVYTCFIHGSFYE